MVYSLYLLWYILRRCRMLCTLITSKVNLTNFHGIVVVTTENMSPGFLYVENRHLYRFLQTRCKNLLSLDPLSLDPPIYSVFFILFFFLSAIAELKQYNTCRKKALYANQKNSKR